MTKVKDPANLYFLLAIIYINSLTVTIKERNHVHVQHKRIYVFSLDENKE